MRFEVIVSLRFLREGRFQTLLTLAGWVPGVIGALVINNRQK